MNQNMISIEIHNDVAIISLHREVTNALDLNLLNLLAETLERMNTDSISSLILTSSNDKFFSIGFDIPQLFEFTKKDFEHFFQTFNRFSLDLYTYPKPTIAAITGHAIAGGCILALCCDYRFIAEGRKLMGLNEIKLGVPVPYPADCILRQLVGSRNAREILNTGEFYQPEKLLKMGMVDRVLPPEQVLPRALEKAELLGAMPQEAFAMIKRNRVEYVEAHVLTCLAEKEHLFIERWYSNEVRQRLREAIEKF